uniref:O-acyltransferase WSD1 C-terminal domain-containing protein n=2 Tax=Clastoptera arizonana TaxID=38151 RepID=A0A1B6CV41_9HEMI
MSNIGAIKWTPIYETINKTLNNKTLLRQLENKEIMHSDFLITATFIGTLAFYSILHQHNKAIVTSLLSMGCLILTAFLLLIFGPILLLLVVYRQIAKLIISRTCSKGIFAGLMDGVDAFWAVESHSSYSVINVLATTNFNLTGSTNYNNNDVPLRSLQEVIFKCLLCSPPPFPKLLCFRKLSKFGYFYWEKQTTLNINNHVRSMEIGKEKGFVTEEDLKHYLSTMVNLPLPCDNKSCWEILVGRYPLINPLLNEETINKACNYPILFRIHHTLGDGVALINLLINFLSEPCLKDSTPATFLDVGKHSTSKFEILSTLITDNKNLREHFLNLFSKSFLFNLKKICIIKLFKFSKSIDIIYVFIKFVDEAKIKIKLIYKNKVVNITTINDFFSNKFLKCIQVWTKINKFLNQELNKTDILLLFSNKGYSLIMTLIKKILQYFSVLTSTITRISFYITKNNDENPIYAQKLSGFKIIAWYIEKEKLLISKIKAVRSRTGAHFSDIILTALSASLESYFEKCHKVPKCINIVIPARLNTPVINSSTNIIQSKIGIANMTQSQYGVSKNQLDNGFSVALLTLPIANTCTGKLALFNKLRQVRKETDTMKNSDDFFINYWFLKIIGALFPVLFLRPILARNSSSIVVSNMPGPEKFVKLGGFGVHDLIFWTPNKETTGVGVTILSYEGRLQFGIIADQALISHQKDAQSILDGMVAAIIKMDQISSNNC